MRVGLGQRAAGRRPGRGGRRLLAFAVVVAGAVPATVAAQTDTGDVALYGYAATASADGSRTMLESKRFLLSDRLIDLGAPTAQASVDGNGRSWGYAALPEPGELVRSIPGLAAAVNPAAGVPDYPLVAASEHPATPHSEVKTQSYSLEADSTAHRSEATATTGASTGEPSAGRVRSRAVAELVPARRRIEAHATATVDAVAVLGGLVRIARVESRASAVQELGGEVQRASEFKAEGVSVVGQAVKVNQDGLVLGNTDVPLPVGGNVLADALADAGVSVRYLDPVETEDGIVSAGLEIRQRVEIPNAPEPGYIVTVLGRTAAFVTPPSADETGTSTTTTLTPTTVDTTVDTPPTEAAGSDGGVAAPPAFPTAGPPARVTPRTPTGNLAADTAFAAVLDRSLPVFYLLLVVAAATALGGSSLFRWLAVRSPWTR